MADQDGEKALSGIIDELAELGDKSDEVSVHDLRETVGDRSFGPFLLIPALIEISPIGGIPGLPTVLALVIGLFAVQILFGRSHLWLPGFIERRTFEGEKLAKGMRKMKRVAGWADRLVHPRLEWLTKAPWTNIAAAICILLAATVPPLEVVPFASTAPMGAIALFGLGLLARDGVVVALAGAVSLVSLYVVYASLVSG